eukprot:TRINITY_DN7312_c0_g1_i2.p1 TRINITY_DN7312_c0_g1~~TRINITY_DN7312_c0_g1_i2.p1  ORF type:complete len:363 (+),score=104.88 TRINITY_DN7312_c0_g1_i2:119-1207(+)
MDSSKQASLLAVVELLKAQPELIHSPELDFFKEYLVSLNATLPPAPSLSSESVDDDSMNTAPDLDLTDVVMNEDAITDYVAGQPGVDGDRDACMELSSQGKQALNKGDVQQALQLLNQAVIKSGNSARPYALRCQAYVMAKQPSAAIKDGDAALKLNPDSGAALKWRGKAYAMTQQWEAAVKDLAAANQLDYNEDVTAWLKQCKENLKKLQAQQKQQQTTSAPASASGSASKDDPLAGFNIPPNIASNPMAASLLKDPEVLQSLQDPEVMEAFQAIMANPMSFFQYQSNPKVAAVTQKMMAKMGMGGMGGMPGGMPNMPTGFPGGAPQAQPASQPSQPSASASTSSFGSRAANRYGVEDELD